MTLGPVLSCRGAFALAVGSLEVVLVVEVEVETPSRARLVSFVALVARTNPPRLLLLQVGPGAAARLLGHVIVVVGGSLDALLGVLLLDSVHGPDDVEVVRPRPGLVLLDLEHGPSSCMFASHVVDSAVRLGQCGSYSGARSES